MSPYASLLPRVRIHERVVARLAGLAFAVLALSACDDRLSVAPPRPAAPPMAANAWVVVSDSNARAGAMVSLSAYARSAEGGAIGSFTARLLYDSLQLKVIEIDSVGDGALRAVNPVPGDHRIAGASARGIRDGLLFRVRAQVVDPRGLRRVGLVLDELHSVRFAELTKALEVKDGRAALLSSMPGVRVAGEKEKQP